MGHKLRGSKEKGTLEKLESLEKNYDITSIIIVTIFKYTHTSPQSAVTAICEIWKIHI